MTQAERDRLVALKKAKKKLITQRQAADELGITQRHVRRLLRQLKRRGDEVVAHALRGLPSNRKISTDTEREAVAILSQSVYRGFGPTLASEYLAKKHDIAVSRETVRQWMIGAKLWKARKQRIEKVHEWRPRRSRFGELVQWDTSPHDWLERRGEEILLINMIDDATSRWFARFVASDSTVENMNLLERYLKKHKRPLAFYSDKAAIFQTAEKTKRDGSRLGKSREELPCAGHALRLGAGLLHKSYSGWGDLDRFKSWDSEGGLLTLAGRGEVVDHLGALLLKLREIAEPILDGACPRSNQPGNPTAPANDMPATA